MKTIWFSALLLLLPSSLCRAASLAASGHLRTVAVANRPAPGVINQNFASFGSPPAINNLGQVAFYSQLVDPVAGGISATGIWSEGGGQLHLNQLGNFGAPSSLLFNSAGETATGEFSLNDAGLALGLIGGGSAVATSGTGGGNVLAQSGDQAPGTNNGTVFDTFTSLAGLNSANQAGFLAALAGPNVSSSDNVGIWSGAAGDITLVMRSGSTAPGVGQFSSPLPTGFDLNNAGQVVFQAVVIDPAQGALPSLWSNGHGNLHVVARTFDQAVGAPVGALFGPLFPGSVIGGNGDVAFQSRLFHPLGSFDRGIWAEHGGVVSLVAQDGGLAPGTGGQLFSELGMPSINSHGQVAFEGTTNTGQHGIWAENQSHVLQLMALVGDTVQVGAGISGVIASLEFSSGANTGDGRQIAFNDFGQLTFDALLSNPTPGSFANEAIFVVTVPEPSTLVLALMGMGLLARSAARRR